MAKKRKNVPNEHLDAAVMERMRDACAAHDVDFRATVAALCEAWMAGKETGAQAAAAPPAPPPLANVAPEPEPQPEPAAEPRPLALARTTWECLTCFTHVTLSKPPARCQRCAGRRFRVAPADPDLDRIKLQFQPSAKEAS